jgi:hypothetical protein
MDHIDDVKEEQSFARLGMGVPNNEGIVFVAFAEAVPTACQDCGYMTYG